LIILGGWNNSSSIIGRLGEHDDAVKAAKRRETGQPPLVELGRSYHFTITRQGGSSTGNSTEHLPRVDRSFASLRFGS